MKLKSLFPLLLIIAGITALSAGGLQLAESKIKGGQSLQEARQLVGKETHSPAKKPKEGVSGSGTPGFGDVIGLLDIPAIKSELAIVEGTDPDDLDKGVGHYKGSFFPGEKGQIVLSGHRDTVFRRLGELKKGDILNIITPSSGTNLYEITGMKIVDSDDLSIITLQNKEEELLLTTCYPFSYIGNAPQRYIIYAKPKIR